jgi:8-oxo-dGTP pyrophosphatase MutT (NUDIX family)
MTWRRTGFVDQQVATGLPEWLYPLARAVPDVQTSNLTQFAPTDGQGRSAAVLVLFGDGPDVLVIERARGPVAHSGQPAFPGGAREESDVDTFATALREAQEETGVDPEAIDVFGALPDLWVPVSDYVVSPVLGWWHSPHPVQVQDPSEVSRVQRVDLSALVDPANRYTVVHPSGYRGPGFAVHDLVIWGFTAGVLSGLLDLSGWQKPWDTSREIAVSA